MIATKDSKYEPRKGFDHLTKRERIHLAEKMINKLSARKRAVEQDLAHLNNQLTYWRQMRLIELYHSTPVEKVKPYVPRKVRKDKGRSRRKPAMEQVFKSLQKLSQDERVKVIKRLSKEVHYDRYKL